MDTAFTGKGNSLEKLDWSNVMPDDIVDIICAKEQFKNF